MLEIIFNFLLGVVVVGIFYWPGWAVLRVLTLGRYPPKSDTKHDPEFVAVVGLAFVCVSLVAIYR